MPSMKILAIANHKGGVGKTATARALADVIAAAGGRVLLVDSDHQGSLTLSCGLINYDGPGLADVYAVGGRGPARLADVVKPISPGVDLAPAGLSLAMAETELVNRPGREFVLSDALGGLGAAYDLVIIDCPPALGQLVTNALCAADTVLIPTPPTPADMAGVSMFLDNIEAIRANKRLNPRLTLLGVVLTFYDARLTTHQGGQAAMLGAGWPVLPVTIPRSVRVAESVAAGQSITSYEPGSPPAAAYNQLGEMVQIWLKNAK
jgi:chromosome partitioning protein